MNQLYIRRWLSHEDKSDPSFVFGCVEAVLAYEDGDSFCGMSFGISTGDTSAELDFSMAVRDTSTEDIDRQLEKVDTLVRVLTLFQENMQKRAEEMKQILRDSDVEGLLEEDDV